MIRIERRREPSELIPARETGLARAREALGSGARIELSGYEVAKAALAEMQHYKCCYCEKVEEQPKYRDVEHYRPKSPYWWLTWTWDNLLFACMDCNREHKRDRFPLLWAASPSLPSTCHRAVNDRWCSIRRTAVAIRPLRSSFAPSGCSAASAGGPM